MNVAGLGRRRLKAVLDTKKLRKVIGWYTTPSGLVLVLAAMLTIVGLWTHPIFSSMGIVLFCVFLGYRFNRERGITERAIRGASAMRPADRKQIDDYGARVGAVESQLDGLKQLRSMDDRLRLRLDYRVRRVEDVLAGVDDAGVADRRPADGSTVDDDSSAGPGQGSSAAIGDGADLAAFRSDVGVVLARGRDSRRQMSRLVLIVSPERSGSTFLFDALRSLPAFTYRGSYDVYRSLGLTSTRYPERLLNGRGNQAPIEVGPSLGGFLPTFRVCPDIAAESADVERVHPSALQFEVERVAQLREIVGSERLRVVALVRDPLLSIQSYCNYRIDEPSAETPSLAKLVERHTASFEFIERLVDDPRLEVSSVIDFKVLADDPCTTIARLGSDIGCVIDETEIAPVLENIEAYQRSRLPKPPYHAGSDLRVDGATTIESIEAVTGPGSLDRLMGSYRRLAALSHA